MPQALRSPQSPAAAAPWILLGFLLLAAFGAGGCASAGGGGGMPGLPPAASGAPSAGAGSAGAPPTAAPSPSPGEPGAPGVPNAKPEAGDSPGREAPAGEPGTGAEAGEAAEQSASDGGGEVDPAESAAGEASASEPAEPGAGGRAQTPEEKEAELDGRLARSLSEFDRLLLREQEKLAERAASTPPAAVPGGGDAGGSAGGAGTGGEGGEIGEGGSDGGEGGENTSGASQDFSPSEAPVHRAESAAEGDEEAGRGGRVPPDVGDGRDDDIIARQLREAAMAEEDPELRERLWNEYRVYKGLPPAESAAEEAGDEG